MAVPKNYYNYFDVCRMEGIPMGTAKSALDKGLDGIKSVQALKPIGHLFKEFEKFVKGGPRKQYGILRRHYDYWKRTGEAPKVSPGRPPKWKNNPNYVNINIPCPRDIYEEFKAVVDGANAQSLVKVSYRDMIPVALKEFSERRPQFKGGGIDADEETDY